MIALNKKHLLIGGAVIGIVAVGAVAFAARGGGGKVGKYEYEFATVERGDVSVVRSASGNVQPKNLVDVGSQVSGKITELYVDYNSPVKKNQILAKIDPETFESQVQSARARVMQSEASVLNQQASIERSQNALDVTQRNYERNKKLFAEQAISQAAWEAADRDYKAAVIQLSSDKVSLKSSEAGLAQSRASLSDALTNLERTNIRSPIDGVIINRAVNVGQTVQSSMSVAKFFTIAADLSEIQIEASVVESDIGGIDPGDNVNFTVDAHKDRRFQGQVFQVRKQGAEQANVVTYTVVIQARNPDNILLPGMTANVDIIASRASNVLRVAEGVTKVALPKELQEKFNPRQGGGQGGPGGMPGMGGGQGGGMPGMGGGEGGQQVAMNGQGGQNRQQGAQGGQNRQQGGQNGQNGQRRPGGQGGPGGMGGPGGNNPMNEMFKEIGVDQVRIDKIQAEMQTEMDKVRSEMQGQMARMQGGGGMMGGGGPPPQMMQQMQGNEMRVRMERIRDTVQKKYLTDEEQAKFAKARAEQQSTRRVPVFTLDEKGELHRQMIQIGASDGSYAQVVRGAKEGDKLILRIKQPAGDKK